ncbi:MAG: competence/damage-inducible protein A [Deltaproteobacteria bacterium]|nr:MAG: competence/damage-inducible protein A [Deltaproteobacteria bacterium]
MVKGEIITIGNELISGRTTDVNSCYAAARLSAIGVNVIKITSVGDDYEMVSDAIRKALKRADFIIVTGGLGSTKDDITNEIVARALNRPLVLNNEALRHIKQKIEEMGLSMNPSLEKMAWMPEGAEMLDLEGNACGYSLKNGNVSLYFLPGIPEQMRYLLDKFVIPDIQGKRTDLPLIRKMTLKSYGLNEALIAEALKDIKQSKETLLGFYPRFPEHHIVITVKGRDRKKMEQELKAMELEIRKRLSRYIFATNDERMEDVVGKLLRENALTLSVAESCTGGLIGHRITNVPGSSDYFMGGVVVYSNAAKIRMLGVNPDTLNRFGAVSAETAREMAQGIRQYMDTDLGIAVTGIAGPSGGTKEKPVGTVFIGLSTAKEEFTRRYRFFGNREQIKLNTSMMALDWIRRYINGYPFLPGI